MRKLLDGNVDLKINDYTITCTGKYKDIVSYENDRKYCIINFDKRNSTANADGIYESVLPIILKVSLQAYFKMLVSDISSERGFSFEGTMCGLFNGELSEDTRPKIGKEQNNKAKEDVYINNVGYSLKFYQTLGSEIHSASYKDALKKFFIKDNNKDKYFIINKMLSDCSNKYNIVSLFNLNNVLINDFYKTHFEIKDGDNNTHTLIYKNKKESETIYTFTDKEYDKTKAYYYVTVDNNNKKNVICYNNITDIRDKISDDMLKIIDDNNDGIYDMLIASPGKKTEEIKVANNTARNNAVINTSNKDIKKSNEVSEPIDLYLIKKEDIIKALKAPSSVTSFSVYTKESDCGLFIRINNVSNLKFATIIPPMIDTNDIEKSFIEKQNDIIEKANNLFNKDNDIEIENEIKNTNVYFLNVLINYINQKKN